MNRTLSFLACALFMIGCQGTVDVLQSTDAGADVRTGTSPDDSGAKPDTAGKDDGGDLGCTGSISASDYDQSCTTASDCVAVFQGGNVCAPCGAPEFFVCLTAAINTNGKAEYEAAVTAVLPVPPGPDFSADACGRPASCPTLRTPNCTNGKCTLPNH